MSKVQVHRSYSQEKLFLGFLEMHNCVCYLWTCPVTPVKRNQLSFSSTEINKPLPAPVQCLIDQIQVQEPILVVATGQMPDDT